VAKVKKAGAVRRALSRRKKARQNAPSGARGSAKFRVTPLDPRKKCGAGTSVQKLFRISEESTDGIVRSHLVFLDRHGWYCEHGRDCPAVSHGQKYR